MLFNLKTRKRKLFAIKVAITLLFLLLFVKLIGELDIDLFKSSVKENKIDAKSVKKEFFLVATNKNLKYLPKVPEKEINNLHMIGIVGKYGVYAKNEQEQLYGMILRTFRYQNISDKVEKKYRLPKNLLLAMIMKETGGESVLPNGRDDGGLGLCHIQPGLAMKFGLKTLDSCKNIKSIEHGRKLRFIISKYKNDLAELIKFDDRFHPILTIDAAARILKYYMAQEEAEDPIEMAVSYYGGIGKFPVYYNKVLLYQNALNDSNIIKTVKQNFNKMNSDLTIGGEKADFDLYIKYYQELNRNYGLDEYR